jgi:hypothetical protein
MSCRLRWSPGWSEAKGGIAITNDIVAGLIRHALTALGGALVAGGYLTSDEWTTIAGAFAVFVGVVWSMISKRVTNSRTSPPS